MRTRSGRTYISGLRTLLTPLCGDGENGDGSVVTRPILKNRPAVRDLCDKPFTIGMFRTRNRSERQRQQDMRLRFQRSLHVYQRRVVHRRQAASN